jgi:hypothetical protein
METHNIDSIIRKTIQESNDFYDAEANDAKEKIWNHIQMQQQKPKQPILNRLMLAACLLLFIGISVLLISNMQARKKIMALTEINSSLKNEADANRKNKFNKNEPIITANKVSHDTLYIEKKIIVPVPLITTKKYTDTVYIKQIVYVEKEQMQETPTVYESTYQKDSVLYTDKRNYKTEILISNNETLKKEKREKIKFKFGGTKDQIYTGTSAFFTKL